MIRRGAVVLVKLDPMVGSEVGKRRPAVVVQNDLANRSCPTVTVVPLTSNTARVFPFQVLIPAEASGLDQDGKALCEQIRTVARKRLVRQVGQLNEDAMADLRAALDRHLWF